MVKINKNSNIFFYTLSILIYFLLMYFWFTKLGIQKSGEAIKYLRASEEILDGNIISTLYEKPFYFFYSFWISVNNYF